MKTATILSLALALSQSSQSYGQPSYSHQLRGVNQYLRITRSESCLEKAVKLYSEYQKTIGPQYQSWQKNLAEEKSEIASKMINIKRSFFESLDRIVVNERISDLSNYEMFRTDEGQISVVDRAVEDTIKKVNYLQKSNIQRVLEKTSRYVAHPYLFFAIKDKKSGAREPIGDPYWPDKYLQAMRIAPTREDVRAYRQGQRNQAAPTIVIRSNGTNYSYQLLPFANDSILRQSNYEVLHDANMYSPSSSYFSQLGRRVVEQRIILDALNEYELSNGNLEIYVKTPMSPSMFIHQFIGDDCFDQNSSQAVVITDNLLKAAAENVGEGSIQPGRPNLTSRHVDLVGAKSVIWRALDVERISWVRRVVSKIQESIGPVPPLGISQNGANGTSPGTPSGSR